MPPAGRHTKVLENRNRKASTLWRGGALWGKLRTRCDQARGLGPGRGHHHHRELSAQHGRGGHVWEREGGELLMHRRGLGPVRGVPHLNNLLVQELEGAACVWGLPHCLEEKEKPNPW